MAAVFRCVAGCDNPAEGVRHEVYFLGARLFPEVFNILYHPVYRIIVGCGGCRTPAAALVVIHHFQVGFQTVSFQVFEGIAPHSGAAVYINAKVASAGNFSEKFGTVGSLSEKRGNGFCF